MWTNLSAKLIARPWLVPSWWNNCVKAAVPCLQHQVDPSEAMWKKNLVYIKHTGLQIQQTFLHTKSFGFASFTAQVFRTCQRGWQILCQFTAAETNVAGDLNMKICHLLHNSFSLYYQLKCFWPFLCCAQVICLLVPEPHKGLQIATGQIPL